MIEIEVPATSANLGPGFDCLGIALSLSNRVRVEIARENRVEGCPPEWTGDDNLFLRSFRHSCDLLGTSALHLAINLISDIPPARGLGSSASLAVAGAAAALLLTSGPGASSDACADTEAEFYRFLHAPENVRFLLRAATDMEGHPDNAAPAIHGGFTAAALAGQDIIVSHSDLPPLWHYTACIPNFDLETSIARRALPETYARRDVVHALSHAALMALAIQEANAELLRRACEDRIHEPYRMRLIPDFEIVTEACRAQGCSAVWISGSGPTILAAFTSEIASAASLSTEIAASTKNGWRVLPLRGDNLGIRARHIQSEEKQ